MDNEQREKVIELFEYNEDLDKHICRKCGKQYKVIGMHLFEHWQFHNRADGVKAEELPTPAKSIPKTLQAEIVQRMLVDKVFGEMDIEAFLNLYAAHRKGDRAGGMDRFGALSKPITRQELEMIRMYIDESFRETKVPAIAEKFGIKPGSFYAQIVRVSLRLIHQFPASLEEAEKTVD